MPLLYRAIISDSSYCSEGYIHGLMDGEFMEKGPVIEEFALY
jgi:hypothetical protein